MAQYAIKGYEVNALDFMVRPIDYFNFSIKLKKAIAYVRSHSDARIVLNPKNSMRTVSVKDIRYVEVLGHQLIYHNVDGDITVRGQLSKAEEELNKYNFARCNDCFLVNLRYVTGLETGSVLLGSDVLTISRRRKKEFLESVTNYLGGGN
jgi:DNA-binding LytR/AlgR family response regulator